jgi:NADPH2:quinone reductase
MNHFAVGIEKRCQARKLASRVRKIHYKGMFMKKDSMYAIQVEQPGSAEQLIYKESERPQPKPNEILVKIKAIGINYIDIYIRTGLYKPASYPYIPGKEASGQVVAVGAQVEDFSIGDRVAFCTNNSGSYAEYAVVPADQAVPIPDSIDYEIAAAAMLQGLTAYYLTHLTIALHKQHTILVHAGAGGVGLLLIQMAKMIGVQVFTTVSSEVKEKIAKKAGADHVIIYSRDSFSIAIQNLTKSKGVDVVYDAVGKDTFTDSLLCLTTRGMLVSYGQASGPIPLFDISKLAEKSLYLTRPSLFHYAKTKEELRAMSAALFEFILHKGLQIHIGQRYSLRHAAKAHRDLEERRTVAKSILIPE